MSADGGLRVIGVRLRKWGEKRTFVVTNHVARLSRLRRRLDEWAYAVDPFLGDSRYVLKHVTLTYRPDVQWEPNQRRDFMLSVRSYFGDNLVAYAIVAELQQRGAVHYQMLLLLKRGTYVPYFDEVKLWGFGSTRVTSHGHVGYLKKYLQKEAQKGIGYPKGCRIVDVWIADGLIDNPARYRFRLSTLPKWLASKLFGDPSESFPARREGGGWLIDGEVVWSDYEVCGFEYADG